MGFPCSFFFVARAQPLSGRTSRSFPCRKKSAPHGKQHAKREKPRQNLRVRIEACGYGTEIAGAKIGADKQEDVTGKRIAQSYAECGADDADCRAAAQL